MQKQDVNWVAGFGRPNTRSAPPRARCHAPVGIYRDRRPTVSTNQLTGRADELSLNRLRTKCLGDANRPGLRHELDKGR